MSSKWLAGLTGVCAGLLIGGTGVQILVDSKSPGIIVEAEEALPDRPDLEDWPDAFLHSVEEAETYIRDGQGVAFNMGQLAGLYHINGYYTEAVQLYQSLIEIDPGNGLWRHRLADLLAGFGDLASAISLWEQTISLPPVYGPAWIRYGEALIKANRWEEAEVVFKDLLEREPENAFAWQGLARVAIENGADSLAEVRLKNALEFSGNRLGHNLLASLHERNGRINEAAQLRDEIRVISDAQFLDDPWIRDLYRLCFDPFQIAVGAGMASYIGEEEEAIQLLERSLQIDPGHVDNRYQLSLLYMSTNRILDARLQLEGCIELKSDYGDGWALLSNLYRAVGDDRGADQILAEGIRNSPASPGLHLGQARRYRVTGNFLEAIESYRRAIALHTEEPDPFIELALCYLELFQEEKAIQSANQALETDPGNPDAISLLTRIYINLNDRENAARWLKAMETGARVPPEYTREMTRIYREVFN